MEVSIAISKEEHHIKPTREQLTNNTNIISRGKDRLRLAIKESLLILDKKPEINKQYDNFTNILKLHNSVGIKTTKATIAVLSYTQPCP